MPASDRVGFSSRGSIVDPRRSCPFAIIPAARCSAIMSPIYLPDFLQSDRPVGNRVNRGPGFRPSALRHQPSFALCLHHEPDRTNRAHPDFVGPSIRLDVVSYPR
jgi:hypothetical protein